MDLWRIGSYLGSLFQRTPSRRVVPDLQFHVFRLQQRVNFSIGLDAIGHHLNELPNAKEKRKNGSQGPDPFQDCGELDSFHGISQVSHTISHNWSAADFAPKNIAACFQDKSA